MRRILAVMAAGVFVAMLVNVGYAQEGAPKPEIQFEPANTDDLPVADLKAWDEFAQANPEILSALSHKPSLVSHSGYVQAHQPLKELLTDHPQLAQELRANPGDFIPLQPTGYHHRRVLHREKNPGGASAAAPSAPAAVSAPAGMAPSGGAGASPAAS